MSSNQPPPSCFYQDSEILDAQGNVDSNRARQCPCIKCLKDRMRENGWCPHQSDYMARIHDYRIFSYLAALKLNDGPSQHESCDSEPFCTAHNVNQQNYEPCHIHSGCTCTTIAVSDEKLLRVIKSGAIPLISIEVLNDTSLEAGQKVCLRVHKGGSRLRRKSYVAISHVWAHGLGNFKENALPTCQLLALESRLSKISSKKAKKVRSSSSIFL